MDTLDGKRARRFFDAITHEFNVPQQATAVVVTHLLPDRPFFLQAVDGLSKISFIVPKPKSIHSEVRAWISHQYNLEMLSREDLENHERSLDLVNRHCNNRPLVILDIGGYFASSLAYIARNYGPGIIGVVEDTENGHRRYQSLKEPPCPIVSVARSPLKDVEDFLVGQSIVFSVEALLREQGDIVHGRTACVIGYGKVGRSIAALLHSRHVGIVVYDEDVIMRVQAMSHGFFVARNLKEALFGAGLVFCATGQYALKAENFADLSAGAYVATVTSSDDELQLNGIRDRYRARHVGENITRYDAGSHYFFLLNRGQAVNFLHGAAVGPFIYLVQGEILASLSTLRNVKNKGICENSKNVRQKIAQAWCEAFGVTPTSALIARQVANTLGERFDDDESENEPDIK